MGHTHSLFSDIDITTSLAPLLAVDSLSLPCSHYYITRSLTLYTASLNIHSPDITTYITTSLP